MHIPDGFLNIQTAAGAWGLSVAGLWVAVKKLKKTLADRLIPTMGVLAAFIFAAQLFNFPVAAGTSGHLLGGVLAAIVVGPMAASVILTVVLIVQCLLFQDGGLIALGANIFNMAILGTWSGWAVYKVVAMLVRSERFQGLGIFIGAWFSVVLAAAAASVELAISNVIPLSIGLPAMVGVHSLIGIGEGTITLLVISFVKKVKPEILAQGNSGSHLSRRAIIISILISLIVAVLAMMFASSSPDGLQRTLQVS